MRNYHSLKIERLVVLDLKLLGGIENHLQSLTLSHITLKNTAALKSFLENSKLLKTLILIRVQIDVEEEHIVTSFTVCKIEVIFYQAQNKCSEEIYALSQYLLNSGYLLTTVYLQFFYFFIEFI